MKKIVLFVLSIAAVLFVSVSCGTEHPGYKKTKTGLYYKIHVDNKNGRPVAESDIMTLEMVYGTRDTVLFSSIETGRPIDLQLDKPTYKGDIYEGLSLLKEGDSASFIVNADSFFLVTLRMQQIPAFIKPKSDLFFHVKMLKIKTQEEIEEEARQMAETRRENESKVLTDYLQANNITTPPRESGLYFIELKKGTGKLPDSGDRIKAHFIISLAEGRQLYSSYDQNKPIEIEYGRQFDNPGITEALGLLRKGGKAKVIVPSSLAFGAEGRGEMVPPYSTLVYEVEFVDILSKAQYEQEQKQKQEQMKQAEEVAKAKETANISKYLKDNNITTPPQPSGLYYIEKVKGTGPRAQNGKKVKVHYTGTLIDGTKFDSSVDRGQPFEFTLGTGQVIRGWDEGIALMNVGSKGILIIPYSLGYGSRSMGSSLPAYSTLIFEVELLGVE